MKILEQLSNTELISRINRAADFAWDDEGEELQRRKIDGTIKTGWTADRQKLIILN